MDSVEQQSVDNNQLSQEQQLLLQNQLEQQQHKSQQQPQKTCYSQHQVLQLPPQSLQQQQLVTKQQLLRHNQQGILQQRILQQEHLKQQQMLLEGQQKQEQALRELLELQDNNQDEDEPKEDRLLVQQQRPQLIQQQQQLHLKQQQRQQQEQEQQLQMLQQKQQQQSQQQTQILQQQQPQIIQQQQPQQSQFVQQTVQAQSQDVQQSLLVQKPQPQIVKRTQLVQQSQPIQFSQLIQQAQLLQQSQNVQPPQQNHQYPLSTQQTNKQPPHSQQQLQQQLQQLLLNNKTLPQRIVVLGSQPQQQQLQQHTQRNGSANNKNQQQLLPQQMQCVVVTGASHQQQQHIVVTGNGQTQQTMNRIVVANTSQQQPQQPAILPSTPQQQSLQIKSNTVTASTQQSQQMQRIVVSTVGPQQQQIQRVVTTTTSSHQPQQVPQQLQSSGQRLVIGQMNLSQEIQQIKSPSQCSVIVSQLQQKNIQSTATKQQQQRVVISKQSQLLKSSQQQSLSHHMLLKQQLTQKLIRPLQQNINQRVAVVHQQQAQEVEQPIQQQQKQQISQNLSKSVDFSHQQQKQMSVKSSDENLVQQLHVKQSHQQLQQLHIQPSQKQIQLKQINLPVQLQEQLFQQKPIKQQNNLQQDKHQVQVCNDLIAGQLQQPLQSEPENLQQQFHLQNLQRQKLQECLLQKQRLQLQKQQENKSQEQKVQQKKYQQHLREQVLLQQHLKQQKQLQLQQMLLMRQQKSPENRIFYVVSSKQEQTQQNEKETINQQSKLPKPELLQPSEKSSVTDQQLDVGSKICHIKDNAINTKNQLILSSLSDEEGDDGTIREHRRLLVEAERLVSERYDALSVTLGPRYKVYYDEILRNWLNGRLSRAEFDRDIRKILYVSWALSVKSKDEVKNRDDLYNFINSSSKISSVIAPSLVSLYTKKSGVEMISNTTPATLASILKQEYSSSRSKSKSHNTFLSQNIIEKNKEIDMIIRKKEAVVILEKRLPLHNALITSLVEWMPLNLQRLERQAARIRGITETGSPIRLYTYADIPQARGSTDHWFPEEPGSLARWYWPDHLPRYSSISTTDVIFSSNQSFLAQNQKKKVDTAVKTVSPRPPSRFLVPMLLRMVEDKKALLAEHRKLYLEMNELQLTNSLQLQLLGRKKRLALLTQLQDGHSKLLSALKSRNQELGSQEHQLMERLNRLKSRMSQRRRKVLALFKIRQQELKARIHKYFDRLTQEQPEDQVQQELLKDAALIINDDDTDEDEKDDQENIFLKQHWDRVRLLEKKNGKQQHRLKMINADGLQKQMSRGQRPPSTALTIQLLRDRQRIRGCRRLLQTVKTERFNVNRCVDRIRELQHKYCPCGELAGQPCRYHKQMRRLQRKRKVNYKLDEIGVQEQRVPVEEVSEKEKTITEDIKKPLMTTTKTKRMKAKKKKVKQKKNETVPSDQKKKVKKAKKNEVSKTEQIMLNNKSSKDFVKKIKETKVIKKEKKLSFVDSTTSTTDTTVSPTLNDNKSIEIVEKHNIGVSCELLQDNSLTSQHRPAFQKSSSIINSGSTISVAAAAARVVKEALAASRKTRRRNIAANNKSRNSDIKDVERDASELMPPPPPPPPKTSTTSKSSSVGAKYWQQQQILLDRHKQIENLRRAERERQQARLERWKPEQDHYNDSEDEINESTIMEMETEDFYLESSQRQNKGFEGQSYDTDLEREEYDYKVKYKERQKQNNYYYFYGDDDYYSSDDDMFGSFPPLLHDLRIDQIPLPSNLIPAAAQLPLGMRTQFSCMPPIFPDHTGDLESSAHSKEYKTESNQKLIELNPQAHLEKKQNKDSYKPIMQSDFIKKPSSSMSKNKFSTSRKSMEPESIVEPVTSSVNKKSLIIKENKTDKQLQPKLKLKQEKPGRYKQKDGKRNNSLTVKKHKETVEQHQKKQKYKENKQSDMAMTEAPSSPVERRSLRVSIKLQEQKVDVKPKPELEAEQKQYLDQVKSSLSGNKSASKRKSKHTCSQPQDNNQEKSKILVEKESPPVKKKVIEFGCLTQQNKIPKDYMTESNCVKLRKEEVTGKQENLKMPITVDLKKLKLNRDQYLYSDQLIASEYKQSQSTFVHENRETTEVLKSIKEFGNLVIFLSPAQQQQQMFQLKQILQPPVSSGIQNRSSQFYLSDEVQIQIDKLLTNQQKNFLGKRKRKPSSIDKNKEHKLMEQSHNLLLHIKQQWEDLHKLIIVKPIVKDKKLSSFSANDDKPNNSKNDELSCSTSKLVDQENSSESSCVKESAHPLPQKKRRIGRYSRERFDLNTIKKKTQVVQRISQSKRQKSQILKKRYKTNLKQKQLDQHKRLERIKLLEKKVFVLKRRKKQLDRQKLRKLMHQKRRNKLLKKHGVSRNIFEQQHSKCLWPLVKLPVLSNERLPLREQLMRKIVNSRQLLESDQTQSRDAMIRIALKKNSAPENVSKLEFRKQNCRGSAYWWLKIGMQRKSSRLILTTKKLPNQKSKSVLNMPLSGQIQQTRPQIKKKAAVVIVKNNKITAPAILSSDEKNKLKQVLKPQLLKMITVAEEKWLGNLQSKTAELDLQTKEYFKAMTEKQQQQVELLLKNGKKLKHKYRWKYSLKTKIIVTHPKKDVSKQWKQLEAMRVEYQKQWKAKLSQLLEAKMTNKLFFRELYDRLMKLGTTSNQHQWQPKTLSALKQLQLEPLKPSERQRLLKLIQKTMSQSWPSSVQKLQVLTDQNKSSQKKSLPKDPHKKIKQQLRLPKKHSKPQKSISRKSIRKKLLPKQTLHKQDKKKTKQNKQPRVKQKQVRRGILQNRQLQKQRTTLKKITSDCIVSRRRLKPALKMNLRHLFQLRNRFIKVQSRQNKILKRQQPTPSMNITDFKSKSVKQIITSKWIFRKMTLLLYIQKIILQRQLDRLNYWYPETFDKHHDVMVLLTPQKPTNLQQLASMASVNVLSLQPLSSERMAKKSTVVAQREPLHMVVEKRRMLKQRLSGVLSQLKPLMELWQLYIRFPNGWLRRQLCIIEQIKQKELSAKGMTNTSYQNVRRLKLLKLQKGKRQVTSTMTIKSQRLWQQIQRIYEYLKWRQQRVHELLTELLMALRNRQHLILSPEKPKNSMYSVALKLGKPSKSKQILSKYLASLRLQRLPTSKMQPLTYSMMLKLQRSCISKKISSNYSALLKLHKSSIRAALSTPQGLSPSKHQFSVSLIPLQPLKLNQTSSNISTLLTSLIASTSKQQLSISGSSTMGAHKFSTSNSQQLYLNKLNNIQQLPKKRRLSDGNENKICGEKIKSVPTKKPKLPSLLISSKRKRCLSSVSHPKTKKSLATIDGKEKQTSTIIILDSDDESETVKTSCDESTKMVKPISCLETKKPIALKAPGCTPTIINSDSKEKSDTRSQMSEKSKLTNVRILSPKSVTKLRDLKTNDGINCTVEEENSYKQIHNKINIKDNKIKERKKRLNETCKKNCDEKNKRPKVDNFLNSNINTIPSRPTEIAVTFSNPKDIFSSMKRPNKVATNSSNLLKVAIVESVQTTMITTCNETLNKTSDKCVFQCDKSLKMAVTVKNISKTVDVNIVSAVIKKLTKSAVTVAQRKPRVSVKKQNYTNILNQIPGKASITKLKIVNPTNKSHQSTNLKNTKKAKIKSNCMTTLQHRGGIVPDQTLRRRRRRRLIRTVTVDTFGPAVPTFRDHGFLVGTIEKAIHSRFVTTLMAMVAANSITSYVPPLRPCMPLDRDITNQQGAVPKLSDIDDESSDDLKTSENKVTTSTNTPVELSTVMDILEKADKASVDSGCSTVHIWNGCARNSGSILVRAVKAAKEQVDSFQVHTTSQLETKMTSAAPLLTLRQSRTTATNAENIVSKPVITVTRPLYQRSLSATASLTSTDSFNCNRSAVTKRSTSVDFMTPATEDQKLNSITTVVDTSKKEQQTRSLKRSAATAFPPFPENMSKSKTIDLPADSTTTLKSTPVAQKSKRSKFDALSTTSISSTIPVVEPSKRSRSTSLTSIASDVTEFAIPALTTNASTFVCSSTLEEPTSTPSAKPPKRSKSAVSSTTILKPTTSHPFAIAAKPSKESKSGLTRTITTKPMATKTKHATSTMSVTHGSEKLSEVIEARAIVTTSDIVGQDMITDGDVTIENNNVTKTTTITEDEMRTTTVTRTRCPIVRAPMDVTMDACTLAVSACEQFVRAMVIERFTKAGRGFGTMELRRRDAFAAAMAFDENIRPTPEYCLTSTLAVTTVAANCSTGDSIKDWTEYKLLHPLVTTVDMPEQSQHPKPSIVIDGKSKTPTVLTVETVVETQTTTTTTTTITPVKDGDQHSTMTVYTVETKPSSMAAVVVLDTSARTRGVIVKKNIKTNSTKPKISVAAVKTFVECDKRPEIITVPHTKKQSATEHYCSLNLTSSQPQADYMDTTVIPDSTTGVFVTKTPPIISTDHPTPILAEHPTSMAESRFFVERGRPLLRPTFHRRRPFSTLVDTSVMAALQTTAENKVDHTYISDHPEELNDESNEVDEGGDSWDYFFGDSSCLPPVSRLNDFLSDRIPSKTPINTNDRMYSDDEEDDSSLARNRKRLIEEITRQQHHRDQLEREMEHRLREHREGPPVTQEEYYRKFLRLQYGSENVTPGPSKLLHRPLNGGKCNGIVSW